MALCGVEYSGPMGVSWLARSSLRAAGRLLGCVREALSAVRPASARVRDRSMLGHLAGPRRPILVGRWRAAALPAVASGGGDRGHARRGANGPGPDDRDWLADSGIRIGEMCGLWFCDLHLRSGHPCGERKAPHVHVVKRANPTGPPPNGGFQRRWWRGW